MSDEQTQPRVIADQYLWDRTGPVDTEIAQLEHALEQLRYDRAGRPHRMVPSSSFPLASARTFRAAALLTISVGAVFLASVLLNQGPRSPGEHSASRIAWSVQTIKGEPIIDDTPIRNVGRIQERQWLETDADSQAKIAVADIGEVTVDVNSRVQLVATNRNEHRLELERGRIDAFILAPPRLFIVNTPAATAVDLGCRYTLTVDAGGDGLLEVTLGWVALETDKGREVIVPRGARCMMWKQIGPGTPRYDDASAALARALEQLDAGRVKPATFTLETILAEARARDSLTLWHLLRHEGVDEAGRAALFDRLAQDQPPPAEITRDKIIRGDRTAIERWRDEFIWSPNPPVSITDD